MSGKVGKITLTVIALIGITAIVFVYMGNKKRRDFSCIQGETAIYEHYKSAVVLIRHKYTYKITIKHGTPFILENVDDGLLNTEISGTGFFVSHDGRIVTNRHVAEPWTSDKYDPRQNVKARIAEILPDSIQGDSIKPYLERMWNIYDDDIVEGNVQTDTTKSITTDTSQNKMAATSPDSTSMPVTAGMVKEQDIEVEPVSVDISIALHGSNEQWLPCKKVGCSKDEGVDIGVLQTVSEKLPESVEHIVDLQDAIVDDGSLKPGNKAILIGYPLGTDLANTARGILVQAYEGQLNKETDGIRLQYNVTSTHGASGSPVFNDCGQLIAVNYAGVDATQGYNFGIVAKFAKELVW